MIAAVVRELVAAGLQGEALVAAIERIESADNPPTSADVLVDKTAERRRAKDRERQRIKRKIHRQSADNPPSPPTPTYIDTSSSLSKEPSEKKERKKSLCEISPDLELSEVWRDYARKHNWPEPRIDREFERFKNHFLNNGKKARDWYRAWCNWVTSPYQLALAPSGGQNREPTSTSPVTDALDSMRARLRSGASPGAARQLLESKTASG